VLEGVGCGEIRRFAGMAQALVAELVVGAGEAAGRGDAAEVIGQRAVEADVERPPAGFEGGAVFGQGELGLARAGGAGDPQAEGLEVEPPRPVGKAAGKPGDQFAGVPPSAR
jgi:hypothetical protein